MLDEVKAIVSRVQSTPVQGAFESDVERIQATESARIRKAIRALVGVEDSRDQLVQQINEYEIEVGGPGLRTEADILSWTRSLGIAAAPEALALLPISEGYVMVRRYWACPGERLLPVVSSDIKFHAGARARFRRDMEILAEHGKIHPFARGYLHWSVAASTGTIVLNQWAVLTDVDQRRREEMLEIIDERLAKRAQA